jgi:hypothetical protein
MCIGMAYCLTYIQLLWLCFIIAQNGQGSSVKRGRILHLTPSGGGQEGGGDEKKKGFESGRSACFFEPMVVKLVGQ